jgi:hypothetical protein
MNKSVTNVDRIYTRLQRASATPLYLGSCTIVFLFLLLHCYVYKLCVYFSFFLTSGASSPEWVKPTAEGGGLLGIYALSSFALFW